MKESHSDMSFGIVIIGMALSIYFHNGIIFVFGIGIAILFVGFLQYMDGK